MIEVACVLTYLKLDSHLPKKPCFICFNESLAKMMKNAFYFIFKVFFVLKIFNGFINKKDLISKFIMSQPG